MSKFHFAFIVLGSIFVILSALVSSSLADTCDTFLHPTYGKGSCVNKERCPYSNYISNLCESFPNNVLCCFSPPTANCSTYQHPQYGIGSCVKSIDCQSSTQLRLDGYCDGYNSEYTCCYQTQTSTTLKSCGINQSNGKGVCVSSSKCPNGITALTNECASNQVCCYSLQNNPDYYEFRGVWISTVANIDWPTAKTLSTAQQQQELIAILNVVQSLGLNVVVFQIRPAGDAFYNSTIEPWSYYLTGQQGKAPNPIWDPLKFIIDEAHKRNIDVHAWINPYRARNKGETYQLAANHIANKLSKFAYTYSGYLWMDPGAEAVRSHVLNVINEILTKYEVDGIHIDDYFYPYPDTTDFPDTETYNSYKNSGGTMSKNDWRRENVNLMVKGIYSLIKSVKPLVQFGISPFGIWRPGYPTGIIGMDAYDSIFADSRKWLQNGWLDYFTPQLYWQIDPVAQSFFNLLKWWCEQNIKNKLIVPGTALYKMESPNNWSSLEIKRQIDITRSFRNLSSFGATHFTMNQILRDVKGIKSILKTAYSQPALTPLIRI